MRLLAALTAAACLLSLPAAMRASAATINSAAVHRVANASDTVYWLYPDKPMIFSSKHAVQIAWLMYSKSASVTLSTTCVDAFGPLWGGLPHKHHGLVKQLVDMDMYEGAPAPQQCSVTATLSASPSIFATLPVIVKKSF